MFLNHLHALLDDEHLWQSHTYHVQNIPHTKAEGSTELIYVSAMICHINDDAQDGCVRYDQPCDTHTYYHSERTRYIQDSCTNAALLLALLLFLGYPFDRLMAKGSDLFLQSSSPVLPIRQLLL